MFPGGSMGHEHQHGWGLARDSDMVLGISPDPDIIIALGGSIGHWAPPIPILPQEAAQTLGICVTFGGNMGHRQQHIPQLH